MALSVTVAYGLSVIGFAVGILICVRLLQTDDVDTAQGGFRYLLIIPGFAGLAYLAMTFNIGTISFGSESIVLPRYIDWLITTPALVGYVGYVAGAPRKWIGGVMAADALMIITGILATIAAPPQKWVFFVLSSFCHLSLFAVLYRVFPKYARQHRDRRSLFELLQNHVGLLWLAYPLVWAVGPSGLGYASTVGISLIIAYLDVIAKVPYVQLVWSNRTAFSSTSQAVDTEPTELSVADD